MPYQEIAKLWERTYPDGTSQRFMKLDALDKLRLGSFYDILKHPFDKEEESGKVIPLRDRRPAVQYNLAKIITQQTAALLFGDDHAPHIHYWTADGVKALGEQHKATQFAIEAILYETDLKSIMLEAALKGSSGSAAIVISRLDNNKPWLDVYPGKYCTPVFDPGDPSKINSLIRIYKVDPGDLMALGYFIPQDKQDQPWWIKIVLDTVDELWSYPLCDDDYRKLGEDDGLGHKVEWTLDPDSSGSHGFKFCPAIWLRNSPERREIDGESTYGAVVDTHVEIDYLLSQIGRGFRYTADPLLAVTKGDIASSLEPAGGFGGLEEPPAVGADANSTTLQKSPARAVVLPHGATVEMLEITGEGLKEAGNHVKLLREYAIEVLSGMKADQEHAHGGNASSGRALEILHQALIWLVERLRICYGNRGMLLLVKMLLQALVDNSIILDEVPSAKGIEPNLPLRLFWPEWYRPQGQELQYSLAALNQAAGGTPKIGKQIIPLATAARHAAQLLGEPNPNEQVEELLKENPQADQLDLLTTHLNPPPPPTPPGGGAK